MPKIEFELKNEGNEKSLILDDITYKLNENGDAVNDKGEIVKSSTDIATLEAEVIAKQKAAEPITTTLKEGDSADIDGVVYKINKDGAAIDDTGIVKYTKEQIASFNITTTDTTKKDEGILDIAEVQKVVNIIPVDDTNKPFSYENSIDGLTKYVTDVRDIGYKQGTSEGVTNLINTYPIISDVIAHLRVHGSMDNFTQIPDYTKVQIDEKNVDQIKEIIFTGRRLRGEDPAAIETYYNYLKDSDKTVDNAKLELNYVRTYYNGVRQQRDAEIADIEVQEREDLKTYWGVDITQDGRISTLNVKDSVYSKIFDQGVVDVNNSKFRIPDNIRINESGKVSYKTKQDFFNYMFVPVPIRLQDGKLINITKHEYDSFLEEQSRSVDKDIFEAFRRFVKYDDSQIIMDKVNSHIASSIPKFSSKKADSTPSPKLKIII